MWRFNQKDMKVKNINIVLLGVALLFWTSFAMAQDLIQATQSGINTSKNASPNRIAEQIISLNTKGDFAKIAPFEISAKNLRTQHRDYIDDAVYLQINKDELRNLTATQKDYITLDIPVSADRGFQVELVKVNILSDDFQMTTHEGKIIYSDDFPGVFYRGIVKGDVSIFDDNIQGLIADDGGNYILGNLKNLTDTYILYNDKKLKIENSFTCGIDDTSFEDELSENVQEKSTVAGNCVNIYIEADYATYQSLGSSVSNVANYIGALFNNVSMLYANEGISIRLSQIGVWTIPDVYLPFNNTFDVRTKFRQFRTSFNGDLAHLISTRGLGGGIAYIDVLCNSNYAYAVTADLNTIVIPFPTPSRDVNVFAHELGHNFGSRHTHACVWNGNNTAIDGCSSCQEAPNPQLPGCNYCPLPPLPLNGGTIMSYCYEVQGIGVNFNFGFGLQPGNLIRSKYNNAWWCNSPCNTPCPTNLNVTTNYIFLDNIDLEASDIITASNSLYLGSFVDYDAGVQIDLVDGFHARYGCDFDAFIDGCGGLYRTDNDEQTPDYQSEMLRTISTELHTEELTIRNYPNPFTGMTTIEYSLPKAEQVSLTISDISGKIVRHLLQDKAHEAGIYTLQLDASMLSPGIYISTLQTTKALQIHKMTVVK